MNIHRTLKKETDRIARIIERFEEAVRVHELKGAMDPEDWDSIQQEYESSKTEVYAMLGLDLPKFNRDSGTNHP